MSEPERGTAPTVSVVIATYNRAESVARLLGLLAGQTLGTDHFEVLVADDGSAVPVAEQLAGLALPYALTLLSHANAGPAAARHLALTRARGSLVVVVDDDMRVGPNFLSTHLAAHPEGSRRVALGPLRLETEGDRPLFERFHLRLLEKHEIEVRSGQRELRGTSLYTGNVSFRRADYFAVGGFDPAFRISEDTELGVRLDRAGVEFLFADEGATAIHASDHTSTAAWMRRAASYGASDARVSAKHPGVRWTDPWRFLFLMSPVARPLLLASALAPTLMRPVILLAMRLAQLLDRLGVERVAIAGTTLVYGLQYFTGVRAHAGSLSRTVAGLVRYLRGSDGGDLDAVGRLARRALGTGGRVSAG